MSTAELGRRRRASFITDYLRPENACTTVKDGAQLDTRLWDGRSADACLKRWRKVRKECTKFKSCRDRIVRMELTGNPPEAEIDRCASLSYSEAGSSSKSSLYDCVRNPQYHI